MPKTSRRAGLRVFLGGIPNLLDRARAKLWELIPLQDAAPVLAALPLAEAMPWLWAVAARTRYPVAELPALAALGHYPGLARPWQPGWTTALKTHSFVAYYKDGKPTETCTSSILTLPAVAPSRPAPPPLALYAAHVRLPQERHNSLFTLTDSLPYTLALLPQNPAPLTSPPMPPCAKP